MKKIPVYIAGAGIISALGSGLAATAAALRENSSAIVPLSLFPLVQGDSLPVGQVGGLEDMPELPRTHRLALTAARQAMQGRKNSPDAVIIGTTTGGMLESEQLLRHGIVDTASYRYHGLNTVAQVVGDDCGCRGPMLTVSTACSSGAVALTLALRMLRRGRAECVLVGGVDSLCRLTYFGFHSLQLVDRNGCRPLDKNRQGMAVAEGAAMLLLTNRRPQNPLAELLGAGLSCDAWHPAAPHPQGAGALAAMRTALADAGISPADIDYINLHGTGTRENDLAEAKAVRSLFPDPPPLSSIKGATGHSLAAAGAIEAVVAVLAVRQGLLPGTVGLEEPDRDLRLQPLRQGEEKNVDLVLSNSFGFGGNNGSLVIGRPRAVTSVAAAGACDPGWLTIHGASCLTGAGGRDATMEKLLAGESVAGRPADDQVSRGLDPGKIRRLKRLPRMALNLSRSAFAHCGPGNTPRSVFMGTGWGALSETHAFLERLAETDERFPSPTDFVGSVHNGPAGQVALMFEATGANITTSGGDYSFEQALIAADLMLDEDEAAFVLGADEYQENLSPLFDPSARGGANRADGGSAFVVSRSLPGGRCRVRSVFYGPGTTDMESLVQACGGQDYLQQRCRLILAGIPAAGSAAGEEQLRKFLARVRAVVPVFRYRRQIGEFASATAVAAVLAATILEKGDSADLSADGRPVFSGHDSIFVLGLGATITVMEFTRP